MRSVRKVFTFPVDNKAELKVISDILRSNVQIETNVVTPIIVDAITDAVESVKDSELAVRYIIRNHSELIPHLGKVIKEKFPEHQDLFDKLTILT